MQGNENIFPELTRKANEDFQLVMSNIVGIDLISRVIKEQRGHRVTGRREGEQRGEIPTPHNREASIMKYTTRTTSDELWIRDNLQGDQGPRIGERIEVYWIQRREACALSIRNERMHMTV